MNQKNCRNSQILRPKTPTYQSVFREKKATDFGLKQRQETKSKCRSRKAAKKTSSEIFRSITQKISIIKSTSNVSRRSQSMKSSNISLDPVVKSFPKFHDIHPKHPKNKFSELTKPRDSRFDARLYSKNRICELPRKALKKTLILESLPNIKKPKNLKNPLKVRPKQPFCVTTRNQHEINRPFSAPTATKPAEERKPKIRKIMESASSEITCQKRFGVITEPIIQPPISVQKKISPIKKIRKSSKNSNRTEIRVEGLPSSVSFVCDAQDMNPQLLDNLTPLVPSYLAHIDDKRDNEYLNYEDELEEYIKNKIEEYEQAEKILREEHYEGCPHLKTPPPNFGSLRRKNKNFTLSHSILGSINPARSNLLEQSNIIMEEPSVESLDDDRVDVVNKKEKRNEISVKKVKHCIDSSNEDKNQEVENSSATLSEEVNRVLFKAIYALSQCERETEQNNFLVKKILEQLEDVNFFSDSHGSSSPKNTNDKEVEAKPKAIKNIGPDGNFAEDLDTNLDIQDLLFDMYGGSEDKDDEMETSHNSRESLRRGHFTLSEGSQNSSIFQTCKTHFSVDNKNLCKDSAARAKRSKRSYTSSALTSVVEKLSPTGRNFVENLRPCENETDVSNAEDDFSQNIQPSCENMSTFTDHAGASAINSIVEKKVNSYSQFADMKNPDACPAISQENEMVDTGVEEMTTLTKSSLPKKVGEPRTFECFTNWEEGPILHIPRKISSIFASYIGESLASLCSPRLSAKEIASKKESMIDHKEKYQQPSTEEFRQMLRHKVEEILPSKPNRFSKSGFLSVAETSSNSNMEMLGRDIQDFRQTFEKKVLESDSSSGLSNISMTSSDLLEESKLAVERILKCMQSCSLDSTADWSLSRQSSINDLVQHIEKQDPSGISVGFVEESMSRYMQNTPIEARCMYSSEVNPRKKIDDTKTEFRAPSSHPNGRTSTPNSKINERVMRILIDLLGKDND